MSRTTRQSLVFAFFLVVAACSGAATSAAYDPATGARYRAGFGPITFVEIREQGQFSNLYDLVQNLRPRWVRSQGPDRLIGQQGQVQVHMDGNRLGGVSVLRRLAVHGVTSILWVAPIDAAARFGLDHSHGAIIISTSMIHE